MERKGIGPQGLGVKTHNGFWVGSGSSSNPLKMKDLSGDGKVTKKDVLIGRGVINKKGSPLMLKNACWKNYTAIGMKKKNGKEVPNCVPKKK